MRTYTPKQTRNHLINETTRPPTYLSTQANTSVHSLTVIYFPYFGKALVFPFTVLTVRALRVTRPIPYGCASEMPSFHADKSVLHDNGKRLIVNLRQAPGVQKTFCQKNNKAKSVSML